MKDNGPGKAERHVAGLFKKAAGWPVSKHDPFTQGSVPQVSLCNIYMKLLGGGMTQRLGLKWHQYADDHPYLHIPGCTWGSATEALLCPPQGKVELAGMRQWPLSNEIHGQLGSIKQRHCGLSNEILKLHYSCRIFLEGRLSGQDFSTVELGCVLVDVG